MLGAKSLVTHFLMGHIIGCTIVIMDIVIKIWPRTYAVGTVVGQRTQHRPAASVVCVCGEEQPAGRIEVAGK